MTTKLRTLVLNANFQPLSLMPLYTIPASGSKGALVRYLMNQCEVIEWYDIPVKTPSRNDLYWPSVIVNHHSKNALRNEAKLRKDSLLLRENFECFYCGDPIDTKNMTQDHVIPKSKGGKTNWENITAVCKECNTKKGNSLPVGKWKPKKPIYAPTFSQMLNLCKKHPIVIYDECWKDYLPGWAEDKYILKGVKKDD